MKKKLLLLSIMTLMLVVSACSQGQETGKQVEEINVGYFPNISHAPAMVAMEKNIFSDNMKDTPVNTMNFPNGSLFMDALSTGQIDIGYVGPGPVLNRFLQGGDVVVLSNASRGENVLVVRNDIPFSDVKDLDGKIVATASTGCTHDLILRKMLEENGMAVEENGGTVKRLAQKPATMIGLFQQKQIDAALVSEPWASLMQAQGVARVVKDFKEVPWNGKLPSTVLVAKKDFLQSNPELVEKFLASHEEAIEFINGNKEETIDIIGKQIKEITNEEIDREVITNALKRVEFTSEVDQDILQEFADLSKELEFIEGDASLEGLFQN